MRRSHRALGGDRPRGSGERLRQAVDLEHWAAFQNSFQAVAGIATELADGDRGPSPLTVTFLSGDVHFSYLAEVERHERQPHPAGSLLTHAEPACPASCAGSRS